MENFNFQALLLLYAGNKISYEQLSFAVKNEMSLEQLKEWIAFCDLSVFEKVKRITSETITNTIYNINQRKNKNK